MDWQSVIRILRYAIIIYDIFVTEKRIFVDYVNFVLFPSDVFGIHIELHNNVYFALLSAPVKL